MIIENHIFIRGYATREDSAFFDHSWNKFISYTNKFAEKHDFHIQAKVIYEC